MATNTSLKQSIESKPANPLTNVVKQQLNAQFKAIKILYPGELHQNGCAVWH